MKKFKIIISSITKKVLSIRVCDEVPLREQKETCTEVNRKEKESPEPKQEKTKKKKIDCVKKRNYIKEDRIITTGFVNGIKIETDHCRLSGKICYSRRDAGEILNKYKRHRGSDHCGRNKKRPIRSYFCRNCGCFHITHEPYIGKEDRKGMNRFLDSEA